MIRTISVRSVFLVVGKAAITISAILVVASQIDFGFLASYRHKLGAATLVAAFVLLAIETSLFAGLRLKLVLKSLGHRLQLGKTSQVALSGFFFEQVAFGFVGGDAMRLWLLHRTDVPLRTAFQAILIDRCLGLTGLFLLALFGLSSLLILLTGYSWQVIAIAGLAVISAAGIFGTFLFTFFVRRSRIPFVKEMRDLVATLIHNPDARACWLAAFVLALVMHAVNVLIFFLIGRDLGITLGLASWFLIVPPALLISMLPISAGGWGLRE